MTESNVKSFEETENPYFDERGNDYYYNLALQNVLNDLNKVCLSSNWKDYFEYVLNLKDKLERILNSNEI